MTKNIIGYSQLNDSESMIFDELAGIIAKYRDAGVDVDFIIDEDKQFVAWVD